MFEWHFVIRGAPDTDFAGGLYHGRIILPANYPFRPPEFLFLTPNGRFQTNLKICLSISSSHPEQWQPSWNIRTALTAIIAFMPTAGGGAVGAIDYPPEDRRLLAAQSRDYVPPSPNTARAEQMAGMHVKLRQRAANARAGTSAGASGAAEPARAGTEPARAANSGTPAAPVTAGAKVAATAAPQQRVDARATSAAPARGAAQGRGPVPRDERDRLGVTAVCIGILLVALILKKVIRSWGLAEQAAAEREG